jgi:hypothetical protein
MARQRLHVLALERPEENPMALGSAIRNGERDEKQQSDGAHRFSGVSVVAEA